MSGDNVFAKLSWHRLNLAFVRAYGLVPERKTGCNSGFLSKNHARNF